jgi:hypothetical protein
MSTFTLFVDPQRPSSAGGWISCPEHRAKRWLVCSERQTRINGKPARIVTQLAKHPTKRAAYEDLHRRQLADMRSKHSPKPRLGARWPASPDRKVIAQSLPEHQYLAQLKKGS